MIQIHHTSRGRMHWLRIGRLSLSWCVAREYKAPGVSAAERRERRLASKARKEAAETERHIREIDAQVAAHSRGWKHAFNTMNIKAEA